MLDIIHKLKKHQFLFEELVKRDFKEKYKQTMLGMGWSILSPLLSLLVLKIVFQYIFGRTIEHYTIYLFCGILVFSYFNEATTGSMKSLTENSKIIMKINLPKYIFLLSKSVSTTINFILTLCLFFIFVAIDNIPFNRNFLMLLFPCLCLVVLNIGIGLILSALFVFFRDTSYLYKVFIKLLRYVSAIFYPISIVPAYYQKYFYLNPVYCYIEYFRTIILEERIPSLEFHLLCVFYACLFAGIGSFIYKRYNSEFVYHL